MKASIAVLALVAMASPALADHHETPADHADHAAGFTLDTPIEVIMASEAGKAVLEKDVPGLATHQSYNYFKQMSLKEVAGFAPDRLTDEVLAKTAADLAAIK